MTFTGIEYGTRSLPFYTYRIQDKNIHSFTIPQLASMPIFEVGRYVSIRMLSFDLVLVWVLIILMLL
jgi:hypothetical protein